MSSVEGTVVIEDQSEFRRVLGAGGPVVVNFTAAWCAPCRTLGPVLADLAREHAGRVTVAVVDVERAPDLAQAYRVTSMPTLIAFRGGQVVTQMVGFGGRGPIRKLFDELVRVEQPAPRIETSDRPAQPRR
jgi:thioredoxin 1